MRKGLKMKKLLLILLLTSCNNLEPLLSQISTTPVPTVLPTANSTPLPTIVPTIIVAPTPAVVTSYPGKPVGCLIERNPHDGAKKGFLSKAGANTNRLTILFPTKLLPAGSKTFHSVKIFSGAKVIDTPSYREAFTVDKSNRPIYDGHKAITSYPSSITVFADGNCWSYNPSGRVD